LANSQKATGNKKYWREMSMNEDVALKDEAERRLANAHAVFRSEAGDRDIIVVSREISRQLHLDLTEKIAEHKVHSKCTLFLTTRGGDPHGGYRFARCLRHHYDHVRLVIPSLCKSAGTLVAIAADELAIGDLGELGPLDIQVHKGSEMMERSSGLDIVQAMQSIRQHTQDAYRKALIEFRGGARLSTQLAGEFAASIAVGIAAPLYAQIDPIRLGEMQRAMKIARDYGERLDRHTSSLRPRALDRLVADYPSHSFVIDRKEAGEIFKSVESPTQAEKELYSAMWVILEEEADFGPEFISEDQPDGDGETDADGTQDLEGAVDRENSADQIDTAGTAAPANGAGGQDG
jgi:hypothetical protein